MAACLLAGWLLNEVSGSKLAVVALLALFGGIAFAFCRRERTLEARHQRLELAIRERTLELDRERRRETQLSQVLDLLVSCQPLGSILDEILRFAVTEMPDTGWLVLLRPHEKVQIAAARGISPEICKTIAQPGVVPFEAWRGAVQWESISTDNAWRGLREKCSEAVHSKVCSRLLGEADARMGAVLVFHQGQVLELDGYAKLIRLAVEHHMLTEGARFRTQHDALTGLPNRILLQSQLEQVVREAKMSGEIFGVMTIDLDGLKAINHSRGQRSGDFLLQEISLRLRKACKPHDIVCRLSGDDFSVLLRRLANADEARERANACLEAIRTPATIAGRELRCTASIGLAVRGVQDPEQWLDADVLQRHAESAMHCAKISGRDRVQLFSDSSEALDRVRLQEAIQEGLDRGYFRVHYQPKFHDDGDFAGFEALARFEHPVLGSIPPITFITAAEQSGQIVAFGMWVLREVCSQIARWRAKGYGPVSVAVNVSPRQLEEHDFGASVERLLMEYRIPPDWLELELTETLLISCTENTHDQLCALRSLGVLISIDDFGTGYSSLSYLHRLPVDAIKLDRSFVQSIDTDDKSRRLVQAMIDVARRLGLGIVAEGVEREAQMNVLSDSGCHLMQGYLFARPAPAADMEELLQSRRSNVCGFRELAGVGVVGDTLTV